MSITLSQSIGLRNGAVVLFPSLFEGACEAGRARPRPAFFGRKTAKGECLYLDPILSVDGLARKFNQAMSTRVPQIQAPPGVVYNVVEQIGSHRLIVHLLNYTLTPVQNVEIRLGGQFRKAPLLSPDSGGDLQMTVRHPTASPACV